MGMFIRIDSADFIDAVTDIIHDCWFAVDNISFDASRSRLDIPFEYEPPAAVKRALLRQGGIERLCRRGLLSFENVLSYVLEDTEKVGRYDFNRIQYSPTEGVIKVITNIPLLLAVYVASVEVTVEIS